MDSSNLSIFCPEHNQYVQQVCLINTCYQKLLCDICMKKHKDIHKNQQMPLIEFINHLKVFQSIKLEEGEDLSSLQEQVRGGQRVLRGSDGKQSQVQYLMLSCLNGKELEAKTNLFSDKATKKKSLLQDKEVKDFTNGIQTFIQAQQRKILQFEKNMMESMTNQLKRATSRRVLDEKYLKDSAISVILDDLKNNNTTRYNELSKNLQKLHKGFLELKVSKKIFRDMCADTQSRFRVFSRNLSQFFDSESNKLFAFMFDVNEEIQKQNVLDQALGNNKDIDSGSNNNNNSSASALIASPTQKSFHDLKLSLVHDPNHPNIQMTKMILDLETINRQTKLAAHPQEIYPPDIQMPITTNGNHNHENTNNNNNSLSGSVSFLKDSQHQLSQQESSKSQPKITKYQQAELLKRLDYQKKEFKVNLEKTECLRFNIIKTNCMMISSENQGFFGQQSQQLSLKQQTYLFQAPSLMNQGNDQNNMSAILSSTNIANSNPNNSSVQVFITPNKKPANFRIHSSTKSQIYIDSPDSSSIQSNNQAGTMSSRPISVHFQSPRTSSSRQVSFSQQIDQSKPSNNNGKSNLQNNPGNLKSNLSSIQLNNQSAMISSGYRDHTQPPGLISPTPPAKQKIINLSVECDFKSCNLLTAVTNPSLRALGFLEQLKLTSSNLANPLSRKTMAEQANIKSVTIQNTSLIKLTKDIPDPLQQTQQETTKQPSQFIIGLESVSSNKVLLVQQNGTISVWQINGQLASQKIKEQQLCKNIQSYVEVLKRDKNRNHNSNNNTLSDQSLDSPDSEDLLLFVCGQNDPDGTTTTTPSAALYILKYEGKKNRFFCIDTLKEAKSTQHAPLSPLRPPTMITCVEATVDKLFKKNNLPTSLQLITDAYYLYQLNLFDYDIDAGIDHSPTISVHRVSFHKEKYGSSEKSLITRIKIKPEVMIQQIIFDDLNDCIWGHSDYMLFKWRVNVMSKCLETQDAITLCTKTSDILTSMILNEQIIMLTSLSGNIWGIDVMFNKAIDKDCERFKYAAINKYNKIQGKDPIAILAGSKITALRKIKRINSSDDAFKSIKMVNNNSNNTSNINDNSSNSNNASNSSGLEYQLETFFVYSTLSQAGAKLFCFDREFKEVINTISGQQNHIQQTVALGGDSFLVAQEDFDCLRIWKNDYF